MPQTYFELDPGTAAAIDQLRETFAAPDGAEVIRKAVALARIAARAADGAGKVTVISPIGERLRVALAG